MYTNRRNPKSEYLYWCQNNYLTFQLSFDIFIIDIDSFRQLFGIEYS